MKIIFQNIINKFGYSICKRDTFEKVIQESKDRIEKVIQESFQLKEFLNLLLEETQLQQNDPMVFQSNEISSFKEFQEFNKKMELIYLKRLQIEKILAISGKPFLILGYNELINKSVKYYIDYAYSYIEIEGIKIPNWRERCVCSETGLNNRMRASLQIFKQKNYWEKLLKGSIYLTEQTTPYYQFLKNLNKDIIGSEYLGHDKSPGYMVNDVRHEDITKLSFNNQQFDVLITNDVLEHVPNYSNAFKELFRVLKNDGILIITVPFHVNQYEHTIRAKLENDGKINHILQPEYHGDPVNLESGILCFQVFGWKLIDELKDIGFKKAYVCFYWSLFHGFLGQNQLVIVAEKLNIEENN